MIRIDRCQLIATSAFGLGGLMLSGGRAFAQTLGHAKVVAAALVKASPELKWCDTSRRGYMRLSLTPVVATNEWVFMQTVADRSTATQRSQTMRVRPGAATLETV